MKATTIKKISNHKPLLYWHNKILLSSGFDLFISDLYLNDLTFIAKIPCSILRRFLCKFRLFARLLRLDIGPVCDLSDGVHCLVFSNGNIYKLNLKSGLLKKELTLPSKRKILNFTVINVPGFKKGVYFGEYYSNPNKYETKIFYRNESGNWSSIYKFTNGKINHIHNIIQDVKRECLYILTGDFGEAAAIWRVNPNFSSVISIGKSGQIKRACWLKISGDSLIYATDSQLESNHVFRIKISCNEYSEPELILNTKGSSIYHAEFDTPKLLFSTAVEPNEVRGNKYLELFCTRKGPGIHSNSSFVYAGVLGKEILPIFKSRKDPYPFRLFEFGSIQFPSGISPNQNLVHIYGKAVKKIDGSTLLLRLSWE